MLYHWQIRLGKEGKPLNLYYEFDLLTWADDVDTAREVLKASVEKSQHPFKADLLIGLRADPIFVAGKEYPIILQHVGEE